MNSPAPQHRPPARRGRSWSDPSAARLFRLAVVASLLLAAAMPFVARAAIAMLGAESTIPFDWVPATFPARRAYARFTAEFGSGDVVVASWPGCTLDAPALPGFVAAATGAEAPRDAAGRPWFDAVATGDAALERLVAPPLALPRDEAVERLRGVVVGPDGDRTCLIVGFTREGLADRRAAVEWIRDRLRRTAGVADGDLHLAGPVIDNVTIDAASGESLRFYGGPAAAIIFALTWLALRSLRYAIVVFMLSLTCVGISFASLVPWGDRMNPVLIVMPLLVLTLGVSGGIHLVNYLVEEYRRGPARGAAWRAVQVAWQPCALSAGTTAVGLGSLVVSELEPIRTFGFHAAVGVLGTLVVLFLVLPGIFARWPIRRRVESVAATDPTGPFAAAVTGRAGAISALALAALVAAGLGVPGLRTSVGIDTLFTPASRLVGDYAWIEREIGPLVPVEVIVRFAAADIRPAERLDIVEEVGAALRELPAVQGVTSAAVFVPDLPDASGARAAVRKAVLARKLEASIARLDDMQLVRADGAAQLWRITARTSALAGLDYGDLLAAVRGVVEPVVARHGGAGRGITADYTGAMPLINAIQRTLLRDLFASFLSALGVITLVMMVVEGGVVAGLVAMIPNVFPMVLLFGILGWTRIALDIGSVMTASVALGMAVDGTFHFLTFFRHALPPAADREDRVAAVRAAFRHSAGALTQSALVCGIGILAFAASPFAPTQRFAWMLSLLVFAALVGDLVVLPALLTTRAGRWFRPAPRAAAPIVLAAVLGVAAPAAAAPVAFEAIPEPVLLAGDAKTACRDPAALYHDGWFHLFFTRVTIGDDGQPVSALATCRSRDLVSWTASHDLTPRDRRLNYGSPGNVVRDGEEWVLCLQTYPRPLGERYGDQTSRLWTIRSRDLETWGEPELLRVKGPDVPVAEMGRMIDPFLLADKDEPGRWWCLFKQDGVGKAWSPDLRRWTYAGRFDGGENACVIVDGADYVLFHSPGNGVGVKRSRDLETWRDEGLLTLGQRDWTWARGRLTAGFVLDLRREPAVGKALMFFHGSAYPETDPRGGFDNHASIALAWSDDLRSWHWPGEASQDCGLPSGNRGNR